MNNFVENWLLGSGTVGTILGVSIADVKEVIWIIYIVIQLMALIFGFTIKAIKYYKNDGKIDENEKEELKNDLKEIGNNIDNLKK